MRFIQSNNTNAFANVRYVYCVIDEENWISLLTADILTLLVCMFINEMVVIVAYLRCARLFNQ